MLTRVTGQLDQSVELFELAVSRCRDDGFRPQLTRSYSHYVEMLLDRDKPGGRGRVFAVQDEALALTRDTGARPLAKRVLLGREILPA